MTRKEIFKEMINLYRNSSRVEKFDLVFQWERYTPLSIFLRGNQYINTTNELFQKLQNLYVQWRSAPD